MAIENLTKNSMLVRLAKEPHFSEELERVSRIICEGAECDVVLDFSDVGVMTSSSICGLLTLRSLLKDRDRNLIFCNAGFLTRCIFRVVGLDKVFIFADSKAESERRQ